MMQKEPSMRMRPIIKLGKYSNAITIPIEWFKQHNIDPDEVGKLLVIADRDIVIINPDRKEIIYEEISGIVTRIREQMIHAEESLKEKEVEARD